MACLYKVRAFVQGYLCFFNACLLVFHPDNKKLTPAISDKTFALHSHSIQILQKSES